MSIRHGEDSAVDVHYLPISQLLDRREVLAIKLRTEIVVVIIIQICLLQLMLKVSVSRPEPLA